MKSKLLVAISTFALPLTLAVAQTVFAQDDATPASASMKAAGKSAQMAGTDAASAVKQAYTGTRTAVKDTVVTARVKSALNDNKDLGSSEIHVDTVAGVVTLTGAVQNDGDSKLAEQLALRADGVKNVVNRLSVATGQNIVN